MLQKVFLIMGMMILGSSIAMADPLFGNNRAEDLQVLLAAPQITIANYELAKDDLNVFYKARDYKPAWNFIEPENAKAFNAFIDSLDQLIIYHGLQNEDYPTALMRKMAASSDEEVQNQLELLMTDMLLELAHDLHGDILNLDDLYPGWNFHRKDIDIPTTMAAAVASNSLNDYIDSLTPKTPTYRQLATDLGTYRALAMQGGWPKIDSGASLHIGDRSHRIIQLRARLAAEKYITAPTSGDQEIYDAELGKAVQAYQQRNGFDADGSIGPKTLTALNTSIHTRIDQIRANMERWRHMPESFPPDRYIVVNIPAATIDIYDNSKNIYHGIVIDGRVDRKTPFIQSAIRSMIINPTWHVPTSIAQKDILPKLQKDPHYLEKLGFVISGSADDPHGRNINWKSIKEDEFDFKLRQSPGDMNSLGRLKFDFDNNFAVYMHGTPHQELFNKSQRDLSSGCVRLRDPEQVAQILLSGNKGDWSIQHIDDEINSNQTRWIGLTKPMPVYFVYWTVFHDEHEQVNFRDDIYDYDRFLIENMKEEAKGDDKSVTLSPHS